MSWERIRGHEPIVESFRHAVQRQRLAHAYLFVGPPGVGKRLFAEELAKSLLCEASAPDALAACDHCPACAMVAARTHPDFFIVDRPEEANEIPIETMRELCQNFSLKPARGHGKVAILDDADDLNDASANCFLKTLEEPPPRSVFILVGTSLERQLATVVSRCQVIRFPPLPESLVKELLRTQGPTDEGQLARVAGLSDGSPGLAKLLAEPALWEFRQVFLRALAQAPPDTVALARAFVQFVEDAGKDTASQRRRAGLFLRLLVQFLNDVLAQSVGEASIQEPDDAHIAAALLKRYDADGLLRLLDRCLEAEHHLDRYAQLTLAVEGLVDALGQPVAV